jgi:hypothetical protein
MSAASGVPKGHQPAEAHGGLSRKKGSMWQMNLQIASMKPPDMGGGFVFGHLMPDLHLKERRHEHTSVELR